MLLLLQYYILCLHQRMGPLKSRILPVSAPNELFYTAGPPKVGPALPETGEVSIGLASS